MQLTAILAFLLARKTRKTDSLRLVEPARFSNTWSRAGAAFALLTVPLIGQQETSRSANFYLLEKEAALGNSYAEDFRRQTPSVDDATLRAYVSNVAARLNEFAHSPFPLIIEISGGADSKLEAVSLPGGHLFVSLRLLAGADNEAELAAPIAHAIAHIATREVTRGESGNLATMPLIFMGSWAHDHATASTLIPLGFRKLQQEHEAKAIFLAEEWMAQTGLADQTVESREFVAARERARAILAVQMKPPAPPSLRKQPR